MPSSNCLVFYYIDKPVVERPTLQVVKRRAAQSFAGGMFVFDTTGKQRSFYSMGTVKPANDEATWPTRLMQRSENWCERGTVWQERFT